MTIFLLFVLMISNNVFLAYLKQGFHLQGSPIALVASSYLLVGGLSVLFFWNHFKFTVFSLIWGTGLGAIFFFFNSKGFNVALTDVVVAQLVAPFIALLFIKSLRVSFSLLEIVPLFFLVLLVAERVFGAQNVSVFVLSLMLLCYVFCQISLRKISESDSLSSLLGIGNITVGGVVFLLHTLFGGGQQVRFEEVKFWIVLLASLLVLSLEVFFVKLLKEQKPFTSAMVLASALPVAVISEYLLLGRFKRYDCIVTSLYFVTLVAIRFRQFFYSKS